MRILSSLILATLVTGVVAACSSTPADVPLDVIVQDMASDETWQRIVDADTQGMTMKNDAMSAHITAPMPGAVLPKATPATFTWSPNPLSKPHEGRHGIETGAFTWLRISGAGIAKPIDVVSLTSTSYTPDAATWAKIVTATGTIDVRVVSAYCNQGLVQTGPFEPMTQPTYTLGQ